MLLHLVAEFDLQRDVVPWLVARGWAAALGNAAAGGAAPRGRLLPSSSGTAEDSPLPSSLRPLAPSRCSGQAEKWALKREPLCAGSAGACALGCAFHSGPQRLRPRWGLRVMAAGSSR